MLQAGLGRNDIPTTLKDIESDLATSCVERRLHELGISGRVLSWYYREACVSMRLGAVMNSDVETLLEAL